MENKADSSYQGNCRSFQCTFLATCSPTPRRRPALTSQGRCVRRCNAPTWSLALYQGGKLALVQSGESDLPVNEPAILFPPGRVHSFVTDRNRGADLVCGTVEFGGAEGNPIGRGLPELVVLLRFASRASADL
jgi:hypothetical protein